jgi:propionate CoA-transferase
VVNLGLGLPDAIGAVANEERIQDLVTLTGDPGVIGGVPLGGPNFGAAVNFSAAIEHPTQFDFIDGGGLDAAYLGFAECDRLGNINASRFANRIAGCGGFINISQNSKKVVFVGTFSAGGLKTRITDGRITILEEGRHGKFVEAVGQITFSGRLAAEQDRDVYYVTERCVFRLTPDGLELIETAPGIDIEADILAKLPFTPVVDGPVPMADAIFRPEPMELRDHMLDIHIEDRLSCDPESNTIFMNYAGMRVRDEEDVRRIKEAVDGILAPLGKRVYSIVNYDSFSADDVIIGQYLDLVRYVEERYYIKVSRYTTSGFMRLKLGKELAKRRVSSHVFESRREARQHLGQK